MVVAALTEAGVPIARTEPWAVSQARAWEARANLAVPAAAAAALDPLNAAGLSPLVLKGLAIADRYPARGLRPMDDIDLLLPREHARQAVAVLERSGWHRGGHRDRDPRYDFVFRHSAAPGVPLELHYEFARWQERPRALSARGLWAARVPVTVGGRSAWGLPPDVELVASVAHAAKAFHVFGRLIWSVDLAVLTSSAPVDWGSVARLSATTRRRVAVAVALRIARRLGAVVPDELTGLPTALVRSGVLDPVLDEAAPFGTQVQPRWIAYALVDDFAGKLRYAAGDLIRPSGRTPRTRVARDLGLMLVRGVPALARAKFSRGPRV